ncbi:MAG: hypothetical protein RMI04_08805, partial [Thermofilaceae archaeon]|nr:hypothetical protein [Thermofilaceae archaeon]
MAIEGTVKYGQKEGALILTGKKSQSVGTAVVQLKYSCDKLFGKCSDEGWIRAEIRREESTDVSLGLIDIKRHGKLEVSRDGSIYPTVKVEIASGRGSGVLEIVYNVNVMSLYEGKYRFSIIFVYETTKGEKIRIGEPIDIEVEVRKPLRIERLTLSPEVDFYVLGDPVEASLKILSEYSGKLSVSCGGALKEQTASYVISKGLQELKLISTVVNPGYKAKLMIKIPEIGYEESIEESASIKKQRVLIEGIEIEKPEIGKKVSATINLVNISKVSDSPIYVKVDVYGHQLERSDVLKPMERKPLVMETPILTKDTRKHLKGTILLKDKITEEELTKTIDLQTPAPIPIRMELTS